MGLPAFDHAGRIPKQAMLASMITFMVVAVLGALVRFWIRFRIQKQFGVDDGFLIFGLCCISVSVGLTISYIDNMYMVEAMNDDGAAVFPLLPEDWLQRIYDYQERSTVSLMLAWSAIVCVKFSFLFFFKKLIDRIQSMTRYWWAVLFINIAIAGYGLAIYILACPHFNNEKVLQCSSGSRSKQVIHYAESQMVLDILSDLLILVIPIRLVWQIKIRWTQKIALGSSLSLTIVMIALTIVRVSGLRHEAGFDPAWEVYWNIMAGEVGIIMTTGAAFRTFFISRSQHKDEMPGHNPNRSLSTRTRNLLRLIITPSRWSTKRSRQSEDPSDSSDSFSDGSLHKGKELPQIPRGTMTGIRTFINGRGRTLNMSRMGASKIMQSEALEEETEDAWPLSQHAQLQKSIQVQHHIYSTSERVYDHYDPNPKRENHDWV